MSLFKSAKVLVIGDVIQDCYIYTNVLRVSPEAPIPVCNYDHSETRPGGAGNVAANIAALGGHCALIGITDGEPMIPEIHDLCLHDFAGDLNHIKMRIVSGRHQIARVDKLPDPAAYAKAWDKLMSTIDLSELLTEYKTVVISDYGKMPEWIIRSVLDAKTERNYVIVDPKHRPAEVYAGADLFTPNKAEEFNLPPCKAKLVTLGAEGMDLVFMDEEGGYGKNAMTLHLAAETHEVADVTGAGDTVVAVMALGRAIGLGLDESARIANKAAGIKVTKFGTYAVTAEDLGV